MTEQERANRAITLAVAQELNHQMNSGAAHLWNECKVGPPETRANGAVYFTIEHQDGGKTVVIVSPKWIEGWM